MARSDLPLEPWRNIPTALVPLPPQPDITQAIAEATDRIIAARVITTMHREGRLSRLTEKLALAAAVVPRQAAKIEARADALIAREPLIAKKTDDTFAPHEQMLDAAERGLETLDKSLALMSNGGDPLPGSGS